jgi:hypothetical protein
MGLAALLIAAGFTTLLAACGGGDAASDARSAGGMSQGMPGTGKAMDSARMMRMSQMQQHVNVMAGLSADSMRALLPMHRQMTANELSEMNQEMQRMKMTADSGWNALVDSVRTDLRTMPEMVAEPLHAMMPRHMARVMRLMQMHDAMMSRMPGRG